MGRRTVPFKPVETGVTDEYSKTGPSDTEYYQSVSLAPLVTEHLNTYSFKEPASPHYAAMLEGRVVDKKEILAHLAFLKTVYDCVICEGAGGLYVPLTEHEFFLDLMDESGLPVVLVARAKLGTINHTLLSLEALKARNIAVAGIVFNRYQGTELENSNIETIRRHADLPVLVIPEVKELSELHRLEIDENDFFERLMKL